MVRPQKRRRIESNPEVVFFKPAGVPKREIGEIVVFFEEFEAIRLKDYLGLDQGVCSERMGVSQPTFHRLLLSARKKISSGIVEGKAIKIEGGNYEIFKED